MICVGDEWSGYELSRQCPNHGSFHYYSFRLLKIEAKASESKSSNQIEVSFEFLAHKDKLVREIIFLQVTQVLGPLVF